MNTERERCPLHQKAILERSQMLRNTTFERMNTCPTNQSKTPPMAGEFFYPDDYDVAWK
jgi:hypothetical protein